MGISTNIYNVVRDYACWFSKLVVVGSPPRSMTSLALGIWLDFHDRHGFLLAE